MSISHPVLVLILAALLFASPGIAEEEGWSRVSGPARTAALVAIATHVDGSLAAAFPAGVWVRRGGVWSRHAVRGGVRDLTFDGGGALWAVGARGVWRLDAEGRLEPQHPGAGERDRDVRRVAADADRVAVASAGGLFLRVGAGPWTRLSEGLPSGPPSAVFIRESGGSEATFELWASLGAYLYRIGVEVGDAGLRAGPALRIPLEGAGGPSVDLAAGSDRRMVALGPGWLAREGAWMRSRLALPPGVTARRLLVEKGSLRLATDRGLFEANAAEEGLHRAGAPLGRAGVVGLAAAGSVVYAATEEGLFAFGRVAAPTVALGLPAFDDPAVRTVQRVALAYLGLGPGRVRDLRRGVDLRGWLPRFDLRAGSRVERDRARDRDQTFTSGERREFLDRDEKRSREYNVNLTLTWDFGDVAFHPEALDLSREARAVIELRDDVLDEVNRLYFERRRVLAGLVAPAAGGGDETLRLRLRAQELAAGLDAWTGGWFSRHAAAH